MSEKEILVNAGSNRLKNRFLHIIRGFYMGKGLCGKEDELCFPDLISGLLPNYCRGCPLNGYQALDSDDIWE
ncbi:MAG: hypothetical protein V1915_01135 [Candidatus Bathyarchaeota archaeon]